MKITRIDTTVVELTLPKPAVNSARVAIKTVGCVLVQLRTDGGADGEGFLYTMRGKHMAPLKAMIDSLGELLVGEDVSQPERLWEKLWREIYFFGFTGVAVMAISALDTAVWDAHARSLDQPLGVLWGGNASKVPVYASQGLWTDLEPDALAREAADYKAAGWRAMKMRTGRPNVADDVQAVKAVREAIGDGVALMADCSRALTVPHAIRLGRALEPYNLTWLEEPLPAHDIDGIAQVAAAVPVPIAIGENDYTRYGFRRVIEARAAHVLMMDLARVGGLSEMRKVAALARAHDLPVSNHIFTEHSLAACATFSNLNFVEYIDWFEELFTEPVRMQDGFLQVPTTPGHGFRFDPRTIEKRRVG
ncbi:mandelate racemase/muconate lactonizing enzyme family protein [Ramlibacter sp.]|uniref:mandelate racemase/muconate lactonizing enzyme family protein n=1 Tax=Ramlibacter sp. TaxID=1917967 RepID=UPI003D0F3941